MISVESASFRSVSSALQLSDAFIRVADGRQLLGRAPPDGVADVVAFRQVHEHHIRLMVADDVQRMLRDFRITAIASMR